jgi:hypothetical protein
MRALSSVRGRRGSVLLHVLVTGVLVALISATLLRMSMLRYTISHRGAAAIVEKRYDQAGFNSVLTNWNIANTVCANNVPNYTCSPASVTPPGTCGCTCTPGLANFPTITATNSGGNCQINVVSTDMP